MASKHDPGLNVIALISGGKDSLYSILHCIRNGHRVVALANLHPAVPETPQHQEEDIDSFMYQTIGHNIIPFYESALQIPLYRASITGNAVDTSRIYGNSGDTGTADQDETESLVPLLNRIKRDLPHANAVSAGAILSTYQRTRIENVAGRLALVPLAWLWMYPELPPPDERKDIPTRTGLLDDMAAVGCEARIIKVASGGLDAETLWENVSAENSLVRKRIEKAMKRFAANDLEAAVLGEGGEYETLALDGPAFLWKKRIVVEESDRQVRSAGGGVSYTTIRNARCMTKETGLSVVEPKDIRKPARLDGLFSQALLDLHADTELRPLDGSGQLESAGYSTSDIELCQAYDANLWMVSNITAPEAGPEAGAQMHGISRKLEDILSQGVPSCASGTDDIVFATVLLRSMKDFTPMNDVYVSLFTKPNPPARVTVACGDCLPKGVEIMVSFVIGLGPRGLRKGLHVQSRSYWAPANIGPYSQAITVPCTSSSAVEHTGGLVFIAGQIPLDPPTMEIPDGVLQDEEHWYPNFSLHATLSLQHLWRIGLATQVNWWLGGIVFLARDAQRVQSKARIAHRLWQALNKQSTKQEDDEDNDLDVWDIKHGLRDDPRLATQHTQRLPNFDTVDGKPLIPPVFTVEVEELPRGSDIEWQALGTTCSRITTPIVTRTADPDTRIWCTRINNNAVSYTIEIGASSDRDTVLDDRLDALMSDLQCDLETPHPTIYTAASVSMRRLKGQIVPCRSVWGDDGLEKVAVVIMRCMCSTA
ncbi:putative ATP binding L-PSP endoribonuclease family protein [Talaromyces proteolyticus]|uniref:Diphthine--ammonia ligase n=1 Tax=Talaromyces proteolyticus TaxID=1131652 RepID=A0AAD4Q2B0_9EURO|nr:putative ATP binding L-PSP endoribonuclease family protein [Talaromyces proteolyticus]KAH8700267.1 putative ATP binding L-PSP endoribonuclease family protein [Talaromyces proteolyticus]